MRSSLWWCGLLLLYLAAVQLPTPVAAGTQGGVLPKYSVPASDTIPQEPKLHRSNRTFAADAEINMDLEVGFGV